MMRKASRALDAPKPTRLVPAVAILTFLWVVMPRRAYALSQATDSQTPKSETPQTFAVGGAPIAVAFDGTDIWVANLLDNTVTKLRSSDGSKLGTFVVGTHPSGLCSEGANIWVANSDAGNVTKLRASDGTVVGTFAVGSRPSGILCNGTNIWVANGGSNNVTKLRASD